MQGCVCLFVFLIKNFFRIIDGLDKKGGLCRLLMCNITLNFVSGKEKSPPVCHTFHIFLSPPIQDRRHSPSLLRLEAEQQGFIALQIQINILNRSLHLYHYPCSCHGSEDEVVLTAHRCAPCADARQVFKGLNSSPLPSSEPQPLTVTSSKHMLALPPSPRPGRPLQEAPFGERRRTQSVSAVSFHFKRSNPWTQSSLTHVRLKRSNVFQLNCNNHTIAVKRKRGEIFIISLKKKI